jgi:two-component system, NarL family, nitrate/nitrite response regulator NarL
MDEELMTERTRILLIDDHTLFRESLARLLEREVEFDVVARCASVDEGVQILAATIVDVVLLDYDLGDEVGTDLLARLSSSGSNARVIMVTAGMRASATLNAANAGVAGLVLKHSDPRHLIEAIRRVASGGTWWDTGILRTAAADEGAATSSPVRVRAITDRQRQVLRSILDGLTNKEIAARMQASETSVKATIQELFHKAGVRTRSQLVRVAIERYSADWLADEQSQRV